MELERVVATLDKAPLLNISAPEKHKRRSAEQAVWESLLKETRKKRSLLALRTFVRQFAPDGLLDVVPVWLLSPETMAAKRSYVIVGTFVIGMLLMPDVISQTLLALPMWMLFEAGILISRLMLRRRREAQTAGG